MNLQKSLQRISELLSLFVQQVKSDNAIGLFDKNRISENFLIPVFSEVYGYNNLMNLNKIKDNYPAIDLGDEVEKVAFQITSDADSTKVKETLKKLIEYKLFEKYNNLIIYVITEKQSTYSNKTWDDIIKGKFIFSKENIIDYTDLLKEIGHFHDLSKVQKLERILEEHIGQKSNCEQNLSQDVSQLVSVVRSSLHENIENLHGTMPLWGIDNWVPLGEMFVNVNMLEKTNSSNKLELDDLWQDFTKGMQRYSSSTSLDRLGLGKEIKRVSALEMLSKNTNFMVVGKPGSGKTTYLQRVVIECNEGNLQPHRIPDLIKLREFVDDGREFNYLLDIYFGHRWGLSDVEINLILKQGRALILIDGLDEIIGEDRKIIVKQIKQFSRKYPQVQIIITCRIQSQEFRFDRFNYVELADFNEEQVRLFAEHWFKVVMSDDSTRLELSQQFLNHLFHERNKLIRDLAITPILLSLTCAVFHYTGKFYSKHSKLYKEALELLLEQWDNLRDIKRDKIYQDLSLERKLELLGYLAEKKFGQEQYVLFQQIEIEREIADFLGIDQQNSRTVLKNIGSQHGLLIERSQNIWSFSHLTFQEYFVARETVLKCNPLSINDSTLNKLVSHIINKNWHEIFLMTISMLDNPDILLSLMKVEVDKLVLRDENIQQFLIWVYQKSQSVDKLYPPVAVRAFYFNHCGTRLLNKVSNTFYKYINGIPVYQQLKGDLSIDYSLTCALSNAYLLDQGIKIYPEETPNDNQSLYYSSDGLFQTISAHYNLGTHSPKSFQYLIEELMKYIPPYDWKQFKEWWQANGRDWTEKLKLFMIEHRNINHDWQFNTKQTMLLQQYSYANELLLDCININSNVSEKVKQEIYEFLLLPSTNSKSNNPYT